MPRPDRVARLALPLAAVLGAALAAQEPLTAARLLREMHDLDRLVRLPDPGYATVQFGSTDRRTVAPHRPGWFANADGFGQEPEPNFERVLAAPGADGIAEFLVCEVDGPGAIVRTWSAGMGGVLRVELDGSEQPLFAGKAYDFLARKSLALVPGFGDLPAAAQQRFVQEDADYLPIPFARRLRITWRGRLRDVHFYQVQVRRCAAGTPVETFAPGAVTAQQLAALPDPFCPLDLPVDPERDREAGSEGVVVGPGAEFVRELDAPDAGGAALTWLSIALPAADNGTAALADRWRTTLLRVAFDRSQVPQVEAPLADFVGAGPWLAPVRSAAFAAGGDRIACRWPMPFQRTCRIELVNFGAEAVRGTLEWRLESRPFDDRTIYFHALWRADHALHARAGQAPIDVPYLTAIGNGRLVGLGCAIVNPPMHPGWRSNWWGEGDEKIFVDGALTTLGTGSEDYFNYSWSHWRYFALPFCGQPLATGPGNCGYVANHRLQVLDDLPFATSLAASMELWTHREVRPLSYARIAWCYARPGLVTDHRAVQQTDAIVPALPPWHDAAPEPGARGRHWHPDVDGCRATAGPVEFVPSRLTRSGRWLRWRAPPGADLVFPLPVEDEGRYRLRVGCRQHPAAPALQVLLDGTALRQGERDTFELAFAHGERFEDLVFENVALTAGAHRLALRCPAGGEVGVEILGCEPMGRPLVALPGAVEAELWDVARRTDGLEVEVQHLGERWSSSHQRWVKATAVGDTVAFRLPPDPKGKARVVLRLTKSWDYGIVRVDWNGAVAAERVDLFCGEPRSVGVVEVDLGERDLAQPSEIAFTVLGHAEGSAPPHHYFGIDCILVRR